MNHALNLNKIKIEIEEKQSMKNVLFKKNKFPLKYHIDIQYK